MLSKSCIKLLEVVLSQQKNITLHKISLGELVVELDESTDAEKQLLQILKQNDFEPVKNSDEKITELIKQAAIELIFYSYNTNSLIRNSDYISQKLQLPYDKIAKIFKKQANLTFVKYIILLKIEKAKEMLATEDFTISEISYMLGYSSIQHLSNQFKKTVGITISEYKLNPDKYRIAIEDLTH